MAAPPGSGSRRAAQDPPADSVKLLAAASHITRRLCHLPLVPVEDWCEKAASALLGPDGGAGVAVWLLTANGAGQVKDIESCGLVIEGSAGRRAGDRDAKVPSGSRLAAIRRRAAELDHIGSTPGRILLSSGFTAPLGRLPGARDWRRGCIAAVWNECCPGEPVVAFVPLKGARKGRGLLVATAPLAGSHPQWRAERAALLESVLPVLDQRASFALGPEPLGPDDWLTPRERFVLECLSRGHSVREVAERLERSPYTVHDSIKTLHRKLHARNRGELLARTLGGMIDP